MHPFDLQEKKRKYALRYAKRKKAEVVTLLDWLRLRLKGIKGRAKERGTDFDITTDDVRINTLCPLLGIPLDHCSDDRDNRPSIDRIDNTLGYVPGNVRMVSWRANWLKSDMTFEEVELLYRNWNKV